MKDYKGVYCMLRHLPNLMGRNGLEIILRSLGRLCDSLQSVE